MAENTPPWKREFPDFDLDVSIPDDWEDVSWHNDICPSWQARNGYLRIWVDYRDPEQREFPDSPRFVVAWEVEEYETHFSRTMGSDDLDLLHSENWEEVVRFVEAWTLPESK